MCKHATCWYHIGASVIWPLKIVPKTNADTVRLNLRVFLLLYVFEKREESFPSFSLHFQRLASLESCGADFFLLAFSFPLLLPLLHLLIYHQPHVLLQAAQRFSLCGGKKVTWKHFAKRQSVVLYPRTLTCQASSSWDSATLCLMVLRSCCVSDSFSCRTVTSSLSRELNGHL